MSRLYFAIEESLCNSIRGKACVVRLPENYSIALPTSEKSFVGNFPYGSSFEMTQNNVLGVYWRNEWKTRDYDLSYSDLGGNRIGWNSSWYNGSNRDSDSSSVVYSGDITDANPEAVELMYIRNDAPDGIFDPNNIKFDTMIDFIGQGQKTIGLMLDNRFYLIDMQTGKNRVSTGKYAPIIVEAMKKKAKSFIDLKEILLRAGFTLWEPAKEGEDEVKPDIDFCNLEKDTLINLLSKSATQP